MQISRKSGKEDTVVAGVRVTMGKVVCAGACLSEGQ